MTDRELRDRVEELTSWARNRIRWCRREEAKCEAEGRPNEWRVERCALQAVLEILEIPEDPWR